MSSLDWNEIFASNANHCWPFPGLMISDKSKEDIFLKNKTAILSAAALHGYREESRNWRSFVWFTK